MTTSIDLETLLPWSAAKEATAEHKRKSRWTHVGLTPGEFLDLCARAERGECHIEQFGVGDSNALWNVAVSRPLERQQELAPRTVDPRRRMRSLMLWQS